MKKALYVIGAIILILIITNPSVKAFKEYLGRESYDGLKRPLNLFICAFYKDHTNDYFGMLGNFWELKKHRSDAYYQGSLDSARMADSAMRADSVKMSIDTSKLKQP